MKYLPHFLLSVASALALASCAAPGGAGSVAETQLGPHSAQKFTMLNHAGGRVLNENDPNFARAIALVVTVEQTMNGDKQEIVARAAAHKDGPHGSLITVDGLQVRITAPIQSGTEPHKTGEARITNTVTAPGGKYKTVTAEAILNSTEYQSGTVSVTVPGQ
jgi:ABC-type glycerol-3-phosphate transport system substrate-binding protein